MSTAHKTIGFALGLSILATATTFAVLQPETPALSCANGIEATAQTRVIAGVSAASRHAAEPEERSGFYSAPAGQVMRFDYRMTTQTVMARTDGIEGQGLEVSLSGRMRVAVLARRGNELLVEVRYQDTEISASHGGSVLAGSGHEPLRDDLGAATVVRLLDDGSTLGYRFPEAAPAEHRNWIRTLWSTFRFVVRDEGGGPWRTTEADSMGVAELEYSWRNAFVKEGAVRGGIVDKRKIGYADQPPESVLGSRKVLGEGTGHLNPSVGWLERVWYREELSSTVADVGIRTSSEMEATCELRDVQWHPVDDHEVWSGPWHPADGSAERADNAVRNSEQRHAARLEGVSLEEMVAMLGGLLRADRFPSSEAFAAKLDLTWILRLRPDALARLELMLPGMDPDLAGLVLSAAGASETVAAQSWLAELFEDAGRPEWLRHDAALALMQVRSPEPAVVGAVAGAVLAATAPGAARDAGELTLGALLARAGDRSGLSTLIGLEARARAQGGLVNWLEALGNAGGPEVFAPVQAYLEHPRTALRIAATSALRSVPGEAAADALIGRLADGEVPVRVRAAEVLSVRSEPAALRTMERLMTNEPDERVRVAAVAGLSSRVVSEPFVRTLLERVARSDPSQVVRSLASEALTRR